MRKNCAASLYPRRPRAGRCNVVQVDKASSFKVGDAVMVRRPGIDEWTRAEAATIAGSGGTVAHGGGNGRDGQIAIGAGEHQFAINSNSVAHGGYRDFLGKLGEILRSHGVVELRILACNIGQDSEFLQQLADSTGVRVTANKQLIYYGGSKLIAGKIDASTRAGEDAQRYKVNDDQRSTLDLPATDSSAVPHKDGEDDPLNK